jgi:hypothetical protein
MAGQAVTYSIYYTHHAGRHFYDGKEKDLVLHFLALWVIYVKELLLALLHTYIHILSKNSCGVAKYVNQK